MSYFTPTKLFTIRKSYPMEIIGGIEIETCVDAEKIRSAEKKRLEEEAEKIRSAKAVKEPEEVYGFLLGDEEHQAYWKSRGFVFEEYEEPTDGDHLGEQYKYEGKLWVVDDEYYTHETDVFMLQLRVYTVEDGHIDIDKVNAETKILSEAILNGMVEDGTAEYIGISPWHIHGTWQEKPKEFVVDLTGIQNLDIKPYKATRDSSIICGEDTEAVEYITKEPYPIVDIMNGNTTIGKATNKVMNVSNGCSILDNGFEEARITCGTHVHMSYNGIDKENYPGFDVVMRYLWIAFYQPYCLLQFYGFQNRYKNRFSSISTDKPLGKNEMFNELPSQDSTFWHFEFRGYGEMRSHWKNGVAKAYLKTLMNLWLTAIDYYRQNNINGVKHIRIVESKAIPAGKEDSLQEELRKNVINEYVIHLMYYSLQWDLAAVSDENQLRILPNLKF
jgi:hypothetical protein